MTPTAPISRWKTTDLEFQRKNGRACLSASIGFLARRPAVVGSDSPLLMKSRDNMTRACPSSQVPKVAVPASGCYSRARFIETHVANLTVPWNNFSFPQALHPNFYRQFLTSRGRGGVL